MRAESGVADGVVEIGLQRPGGCSSREQGDGDGTLARMPNEGRRSDGWRV